MPINGIVSRRLREHIESFYRNIDHQQLMHMDLDNLQENDLPPGWSLGEGVNPISDFINLRLDQTNPIILDIIGNQRLDPIEISHLSEHIMVCIQEMQTLRAYENDTAEGGSHYKLRKKTKRRRTNKQKRKTKRRRFHNK